MYSSDITGFLVHVPARILAKAKKSYTRNVEFPMNEITDNPLLVS